ncbi:MAG: delta-60 repeat domain-containing protein [Solirubrobacterales bacterium]
MTIPRLTTATVLVALAVLLPASGASATVPGELDPSFGVGGKVQAPFGPESFAGGVAVQGDGKILVAGSPEESEAFSIARLLPDGALDPSWGAGGVATTPLGKFAYAEDVAVQPDGKVVAVGEAPGKENEDFAIVRYLANGTPDPSFGGGDGIVILPVGALGDQAHAVAIGPGGRIAVVGVAERPSFRDAVGVAMLESNGTPEAAFGAGGTTVIQTESGEDDRGEGVAFQPDGKIVIADSTGAGGGDGFTLIRLGLDGKPDSSFGGDGVVETPIPGEGGIEEGRISDVVIQPDGKIVGGGYGFDYTGTPPNFIGKFEIVRYLPNGELDPSFGSGGMTGVRLPGEHSFGRALGLAANGKLVLGGTYDVSPNPLEEHEAPALVRFNPNGTLDSSFGNGGIVLEPLGSNVQEESIERLALQPDGKIVTAGSRFQEPGGSSGIVSRYIAEPPPAPGPPKDLPPHSRIKGLPHKVHQDALKRFHGTASDPDGTVSKVQVSLVRLSSVSKVEVTVPRLPSGGKAGPAIAVKPRKWRGAKGTVKWSFKLKHPLGPGRYVVFSRAIDNQGTAETEFSRRAGNRRAFYVIPKVRHVASP